MWRVWSAGTTLTDGFIEYNGHRCVIISLEMLAGNNIVQYGRDVETMLAEIKAAELPEDVSIHTISDQAGVVECQRQFISARPVHLDGGHHPHNDDPLPVELGTGSPPLPFRNDVHLGGHHVSGRYPTQHDYAGSPDCGARYGRGRFSHRHRRISGIPEHGDEPLATPPAGHLDLFHAYAAGHGLYQCHLLPLLLLPVWGRKAIFYMTSRLPSPST